MLWRRRHEGKEQKENAMDKNVHIITDLDGRKIVIIYDIRFQSRRGSDWKKVEEYLKEYL